MNEPQYELELISLAGRGRRTDAADGWHEIAVSGNRKINGHYVGLTLCRILLNVPLVNRFDETIKKFTLAELIFENLWENPIHIPRYSNFKLIDSEGFQHTQEGSQEDYNTVSARSLPRGTAPVQITQPEETLEDRAKTKGWIWLAELANGLLPQRLVFNFDVFDSSTVDTEILEFIIQRCATKPLTSGTVPGPFDIEVE